MDVNKHTNANQNFCLKTEKRERKKSGESKGNEGKKRRKKEEKKKKKCGQDRW